MTDAPKRKHNITTTTYKKKKKYKKLSDLKEASHANAFPIVQRNDCTVDTHTVIWNIILMLHIELLEIS